jgi:hypothetical protein
VAAASADGVVLYFFTLSLFHFFAILCLLPSLQTKTPCLRASNIDRKTGRF